MLLLCGGEAQRESLRMKHLRRETDISRSIVILMDKSIPCYAFLQPSQFGRFLASTSSKEHFTLLSFLPTGAFVEPQSQDDLPIIVLY